MSDIVERLREAHPNSAQRFAGSTILLDAADEIERLRSERQRHAEVTEEVRKVLGPFSNLAAAVFHIDEDGREMNATKPDDRPLWGFDHATLSYGDLLAVRALLSRLEER